jgi:pimeloyl-ACP methyl ester carboxylesterase
VNFESIAAARDAFEQGTLRDGLARYHGANTLNAFRTWNETWLDPAFRGWSIEDALPRIEVPVLVVQGTRDEYATLAQVDAIVDGVAGPVERLVLDCGHRPHRERTEEVLAAVARLCSRHAIAPF